MRKLITLVGALAVGLAGCNQHDTGTGPGGKELTVKAPNPVSVTQGKSQTFEVGITRKGFTDPVTLDFSDLPEGVTVEESDKTIGKDKTTGTFTLKAKDNAPENGGHKAKVRASGGGAKAGPVEFTVKVVKR
jgi:hypothetical protein